MLSEIKSSVVIATSNIVSSIIEKSESPKDLQEILDLYDAIYDHIAKHQEPKSPMKISPGIVKQRGANQF